MSVDDQSDFMTELRILKRKVARLESGTMLQNAAIDEGALTVKSAEGLRVGTPEDATGSAYVYGILRIIGQLLLNGSMEVTGDGKITVGGVVIEPVGGGRIRLGANIVLDSATQKITVGSGANAIVIDAVAKSITIPGASGATVLANGDITFGTGSVLRSDASTSGAQLVTGNWRLMVGQNGFALHRTSGNGASITGAGTQLNIGANNVIINGEDYVQIASLDTPPTSASGLRYVVADNTGKLYVASGGGGGGGDTPPNPYPDGYIWPADPALYGISDNYAAHVARGSAEPGTDVMTPVGTAVYAPANGEIRAVNSTSAGATGRMIVFRADNGAWFRLLHLSQIVVSSGAVTQGTLIGWSGGSGFGSESYYGPHLHVTYLPGPSSTQPPLTSSKDFELVMAAQP